MIFPILRASNRRRHHLSTLPSFFLLVLTPIAIITHPSVVHAANDESLDNFCGTNWIDAADSCSKHCSTGADEECSIALGVGYECHGFTGCRAKIDSGEIADPDVDAAAAAEVEAGVGQANNNINGGNSGNNSGNNQIDAFEGTNNNFCGKSWGKAMLTCNVPCPNGYECTAPGEKCFAATNCDKPLQRLQADMLVTLIGADTTMEDADGDILQGTIYDILLTTVEDRVALNEVEAGEQKVTGRRGLEQRYRNRSLKGWLEEDKSSMHMYMQKMVQQVSNVTVTQRKLPSGSSALDVSMVITGDYRPPPYLDLNVIAEDSINRQGSKVVSTLRERGERVGRNFFERVDGIEAVARASATQRPTREPTGRPTAAETWSPSGYPSFSPSAGPTFYPTESPTRSHDQAIVTGSQEDLQLGGTTTSSYGYIFNMRTRPASGVVLVNGFEFYTGSTDDVTFELFTRLGGFQDFKGKYDGWDLIASGTVKGRGLMRYTKIPQEVFTPVDIPGGGGERGTRAFYLHLETKELIYKIGVGEASDAFVQYENEDVEIWEGESVLYNWKMEISADEKELYYRYPRQYLGIIQYDRLPCKPFDVYGLVSDLPCPLVPTGAPTIPPPTKTPITSPPSGSPTPAPISGEPTSSQSPVSSPTGTPTIPRPTMAPTTAEPTFSPIVPDRANVISVIRNVPDRDMTEREIEKFMEIMREFLTGHTQNSMVIDGMDFWYHKTSLVDADADYGDEDSEPSKKVSRQGSRRGKLEKKKGPKKDDNIPQVTVVEITMILRISIALLPLNLLGHLAAVTIDENQQELLSMLKGESAFYTYFEKMDGIQSRAVDHVTDPPTMRPTTEAQYLASQGLLSDANEPEETEKGVGLIVAVALSVGGLWCCLTVISISYLMNRRAQMQEEHDMEDLLRQEKIDHMANDDADVIRGVDDESSKNLCRSTLCDEEDPSGSKIEELDGSKKSRESTLDVSSRSMPDKPLKQSRITGINDNSTPHKSLDNSDRSRGINDNSARHQSLDNSDRSRVINDNSTPRQSLLDNSGKSRGSGSRKQGSARERRISRPSFNRSAAVSRLRISLTSLSSSATSNKSEDLSSRNTANRKFPVRSSGAPSKASFYQPRQSKDFTRLGAAAVTSTSTQSRRHSTQDSVLNSSSSVAASRVSHTSRRSSAPDSTQNLNMAKSTTDSSVASSSKRNNSTPNQSFAGRGINRMPSSRKSMPNVSRSTVASSASSRTIMTSSSVRMPPNRQLNPSGASRRSIISTTDQSFGGRGLGRMPSNRQLGPNMSQSTVASSAASRASRQG